MPSLVGLLDRDLLLVRVDHEQDVGQAAHVLDAAQGALELVALAAQVEQLLLGEALLRRRIGQLDLELAQPLDRLRDRLPVGQHAAEPAMVDVVLAAAPGGRRHRLLRLALGADEQHAPAIGRDLAQSRQRPVQRRHRLGEVEDVDAVADAEDVGGHQRVPAPRLVAEMHASFEQLAHGVGREGHRTILYRLFRRGKWTDATGSATGQRQGSRLPPACEMAALYSGGPSLASAAASARPDR